MGGFEQPRFVPHRAGEGALAVAEHLGLEQSFGQRCAVHRHEGAARAAAVVVNELRDHLLAAAALSRDENGRVGRRHLPGELDRSAKGRRGAEECQLIRLHLRPVERVLLLTRLARDQQRVHRAPDQHLQV